MPRRKTEVADLQATVKDFRGELRKADLIIATLLAERDAAREKAADWERAVHVALGLPAGSFHAFTSEPNSANVKA